MLTQNGKIFNDMSTVAETSTECELECGCECLKKLKLIISDVNIRTTNLFYRHLNDANRFLYSYNPFILF